MIIVIHSNVDQIHTILFCFVALCSVSGNIGSTFHVICPRQSRQSLPAGHFWCIAVCLAI